MTKRGTILLIEDNEDDMLLIKKAFADAQVAAPITVVRSSKEAVRYFSGTGRFADRAAHPVPFLVLLDLKLSDEDGFALLRWLFERPGLKKQFTLLTLSSESPPHEVQLAYELGAQSFLLKPLHY